MRPADARAEARAVTRDVHVLHALLSREAARLDRTGEAQPRHQRMTALGKRYLALLRFDEDVLAPIVSDTELHVLVEKAKAAHKRFTYPAAHPAGVVEIDLDMQPLVDETPEQREGRLDRMLLHAAGELAVIRGRSVDKEDRDYAARVKRTYELREQSAVEIRKLLEAFRPPHYVIETRRNLVPTPAPERTWFGQEHDRLAQDPNTWFATLKDPRPDGSDAHIFVMARTEAGALAKLLAHIVDGGGFFPMT
jgi:hypothetical protein